MNGRNGASNLEMKITKDPALSEALAGRQDDLEKKVTCCAKAKKLLFVFMGISFVVIAVLLITAIISSTLLENENQCPDQNAPFQQSSSYKFYSTKTLYTNAFTYLSKLSYQQPQPVVIVPNSNSLNHFNDIGGQVSSSQTYDRSSVYVPKIFSQQDSLEAIHQRLISLQNGCKARQLHFFGRHGARLPSSADLESINAHIQAIKTRLPKQTTAQLPTHHIDNGSNNNNINNNVPPVKISGVTNSQIHNKTHVCSDPSMQLASWTPFADPEQGNLLTETGGRETQNIARRFKAIYPEFFDKQTANIRFGTTKELRTAQTALAFARQIDNFSFKFCNLDQFPQENTSDKSKTQDIIHDECFRQMTDQLSMDQLSRKKCDSYHREDFPINYNFNLHDPNRTEFITQSVAKKLNLKKDQLSHDETRAIYDACRYETALTGVTSVLCRLFSEKELKFYEYLNDIVDFYNEAYGHPDQRRSACPITNDLIKSFSSASRSTQPSSQLPEAYFYFTHSAVIQRLIAASIDLENDPEYSPPTVLDHLRRGTAPKTREWQTSLLTPFSANLAFTLYECPKKQGSEVVSGGIAISDMSPSNKQFKVVAALNEQPILLDGCQDYTCDLQQLLWEGRLSTEKRCKLDEICKKKIKVT